MPNVRDAVEASNRLCTSANAHSRTVEMDEVERPRLHGVRRKDHQSAMLSEATGQRTTSKGGFHGFPQHPDA